MTLYDGNGNAVITDKTLTDKKILIMGDSISTDAYGNYAKWVTDLINEGFFDADNVTNDSYHATGFVATYSEGGSVVRDNFVNRLQAVSSPTDYDMVITFGGINDYIGAIDFDTFKSAVDTYFAYLVAHFTQARLCVFTPLRTYNIYKNNAGYYQTDYSDYIKEVARSYCLPILDLTTASGYYPFVDEFKTMWTLIPSGYSTPDGVHPNADYSAQFLAPMIRDWLISGYDSYTSDDKLPLIVTITVTSQTGGTCNKTYYEVARAWDIGRPIKATVTAMNGEALIVDRVQIGTANEAFLAFIIDSGNIMTLSLTGSGNNNMTATFVS